MHNIEQLFFVLFILTIVSVIDFFFLIDRSSFSHSAMVYGSNIQ